MTERIKGTQRAKFFFMLGRNIIGPFFKKTIDFHGKAYRIDEQPFILFANHGDNLDAAHELISIKRYMRFVVSDHLTRKKSMAMFLQFLAAPIVYHREKGSDALYNEIVRSIKCGKNVAMHLEGGKTNNGETGYISRRNATLVKECGCALITYRNMGGYMKTPRWAKNKRKGPSYGEIVNIYSKEQIRRMSEEEIFAHILEDLHFNAYDYQRQSPKKYMAEKPAESAEIILYGCPKCRGIGTLKSENDTIKCNCGFKAVIDDYGFWHSEDMAFDDIVSWDRYQKELLQDITDFTKSTDSLLFSDNSQIIYSVENGEKILKSEDSEIVLYANCFEILSQKDKITIPLERIKQITTSSVMNLMIVTDDEYYEIKSTFPRSATKYIVAVRYLQGKENK